MKANFRKFAGHSMTGVTALLALVITLSALALLVSPALMRQASASVQNYPPGVGVYAMPMHLNGPYTGASTTAVTFKIPYAARIIGFGGAGATLSGTIAVDLQKGGVSLLSAPLALSTAYSEATLSSATAIADESTLTAVVTVSGASATVSDITILPTFLRR